MIVVEKVRTLCKELNNNLNEVEFGEGVFPTTFLSLLTYIVSNDMVNIELMYRYLRLLKKRLSQMSGPMATKTCASIDEICAINMAPARPIPVGSQNECYVLVWTDGTKTERCYAKAEDLLRAQCLDCIYFVSEGNDWVCIHSPEKRAWRIANSHTTANCEKFEQPIIG